MANLNIVVVGTLWGEADKFCKTITDNDWRKIDEDKNQGIVDYWHFEIDNETIIKFFTPPGARRFDFLWDVIAEGIMGVKYPIIEDIILRMPVQQKPLAAS